MNLYYYVLVSILTIWACSNSEQNHTKKSPNTLTKDTLSTFIIKDSLPLVKNDTLLNQNQPNQNLQSENTTIVNADQIENEKYRLAEIERRKLLAGKYEEQKATSDQTTNIVKEHLEINPEKVKNESQNSEIKKPKSKSSEIKKESSTNNIAPRIVFEKTKWSFDTITEGDEVSYNFKFKNTGDGVLEILNAKGTCGCTQPSFPFIPIESGEEGFIGVKFNSKTKYGDQSPEVEVFTNIQEEPFILYLSGHVVEKSEKSEK